MFPFDYSVLRKMNCEKRLMRELEKVKSTTTSGIFVEPSENLRVWKVRIAGPESSPYKDGIFDLEVSVPDDYPFSPPRLRFTTKIYHPNIDDSGRICMDLLKMPPMGGWKPTIAIEGLLIAVKMLLENPNPNDPLMVETASLLKKDRESFNKKAEEYTLKYATSTAPK